MLGIAAGISFYPTSLFALVFWRSRTLPGFAFVIIAEGTELAALFALAELWSTGIHCCVDSCITPLSRSAVRICFAHTGALCSIEAATLTLLAGIIEIAGPTHRHRIGGVAPRQLAIATFALMITAGDVTRLIVIFQHQATVLGRIQPGIAVLARPTIGISLTDAGALGSIEATTLTLPAGIIEIAGFAHRH